MEVWQLIAHLNCFPAEADVLINAGHKAERLTSLSRAEAMSVSFGKDGIKEIIISATPFQPQIEDEEMKTGPARVPVNTVRDGYLVSMYEDGALPPPK